MAKQSRCRGCVLGVSPALSSTSLISQLLPTMTTTLTTAGQPPSTRCYSPPSVSVCVKKGSRYSSTERRVPELIPVLGSQPAGDVSHKPSSRLPLLSARPAVILATLKRAATSFAAW